MTKPRLMTENERAPLYAAYQAARDEAERCGGSFTDDGIIQAAVKAYAAVYHQQLAAWLRAHENLASKNGCDPTEAAAHIADLAAIIEQHPKSVGDQAPIIQQHADMAESRLRAKASVAGPNGATEVNA